MWIAVSCAALLAALWMARPFLSRAQVELNESDLAISIYRDQLDKLHRDAEAGLISDEERDAAQQEIERRALQAAKRMDVGISVSRRAPALAGGLAAVCAVAALGLYAVLGNPATGDHASAADAYRKATAPPCSPPMPRR